MNKDLEKIRRYGIIAVASIAIALSIIILCSSFVPSTYSVDVYNTEFVGTYDSFTYFSSDNEEYHFPKYSVKFTLDETKINQFTEPSRGCGNVTNRISKDIVNTQVAREKAYISSILRQAYILSVSNISAEQYESHKTRINELITERFISECRVHGLHIKQIIYYNN